MVQPLWVLSVLMWECTVSVLLYLQEVQVMMVVFCCSVCGKRWCAVCAGRAVGTWRTRAVPGSHWWDRWWLWGRRRCCSPNTPCSQGVCVCVWVRLSVMVGLSVRGYEAECDGGAECARVWGWVSVQGWVWWWGWVCEGMRLSECARLSVMVGLSVQGYEAECARVRGWVSVQGWGCEWPRELCQRRSKKPLLEKETVRETGETIG